MANLKIPHEKAIDLINGRIDEITTMAADQDRPGYYDVVGWCSKTYAAIDEIYEAGDFHPEEIRSIGLPACSCSPEKVGPMLLEVYHSRLVDYIFEIRKSMMNPEQ